MDSGKEVIVDEVVPSFRIYNDGHLEVVRSLDFVPASIDSPTSVSTKDVIILHGLSARLFVPKTANRKLPIIIYFHGGGFCFESAFSYTYHKYLSSLVAEANVLAVSVEYRLAPENPLPISYRDSWEAIQWVASHSHSKMQGPEVWLREYGDFNRLFLAGDSAGGNITHHMAMMAGENELSGGVKLHGVILIQPYFLGETPTVSELMDPCMNAKAGRLWHYACPSPLGKDHPWINPLAIRAPSLAGLGCRKVLVAIAGEDSVRDRGRLYYEALAVSGWKGKGEIVEIEGEGHLFHLKNPTSANAAILMGCIVSFLS